MTTRYGSGRDTRPPLPGPSGDTACEVRNVGEHRVRRTGHPWRRTTAHCRRWPPYQATGPARHRRAEAPAGSGKRPDDWSDPGHLAGAGCPPRVGHARPGGREPATARHQGPHHATRATPAGGEPVAWDHRSCPVPRGGKRGRVSSMSWEYERSGAIASPSPAPRFGTVPAADATHWVRTARCCRPGHPSIRATGAATRETLPPQRPRAALPIRVRATSSIGGLPSPARASRK